MSYKRVGCRKLRFRVGVERTGKRRPRARRLLISPSVGRRGSQSSAGCGRGRLPRHVAMWSTESHCESLSREQNFVLLSFMMENSCSQMYVLPNMDRILAQWTLYLG